jgi:alpha-L-rhamnosidase
VTTANRPWDLRVEHLDDAFGIDATRPRLSWKLPEASTRQVAYRLEVGSWDSGRIESDRSVLVGYDGPAFGSRDRVDWRVQVWTDLGPSVWSVPASFELGLLRPEHWTASWIVPVATGDVPGQRGAPLLRTRFTVDDTERVARIYATAHGVYELFLNGERVGDQELTPGFTSYRSRLQVQSYDVGPLLRAGENELRAVLSDGWWRGFVAFTREHDVFGTELALLAQVELDGTPIVITDASWESAHGPIVAADLIEGQHTDLRVDADRAEWTPVRVVDVDGSNLCAPVAPPVRRIEVLRPASVTTVGDRQVVDLGQNINGWVALRAEIPAGTVTLTHGESLDDRGDVTMEHLRPINWKTQEPMSAGQVDRITGAGGPAVVEPRHATKGFRYVRVEGLEAPLTVDDVEGVVVHTDLRRTGWFTCSDPRIDRLHAAADWSFRTNACDIPTDCPQRERAGWTGDWQIFAPTAAFLYDVAGFSTKWLRDLAADQRADGCVRNFAPDPAYEGSDNHAFKTFLEGSSGWGDAAVLVPWQMYRCYGDERLLAEQWESATAWVGFQETTAREQRRPDRIARNAAALPHEQYLWDTGWHWGEWCEPDRSTDEHFATGGGDQTIIATAYFAHSARTLARIAEVLGRDDAVTRYDGLADRVIDAWRTEFIDDDGDVRSDRQADHVRALAFDLVPTELRARTADRLVQLIRARDTHLDTGFLATPLLLPVLADTGHEDVAYDLLYQDTEPSWLHMIDEGATTIWESWNGVEGGGVGSLNHYSKGAVISFLHEYTAGLQLVDPAYRRFRVTPRPGGGITTASAVHDSPYGRIESSWTLVDGELRLTVRVPPGTVADVELPDGTTRTLKPGVVALTSAVTG